MSVINLYGRLPAEKTQTITLWQFWKHRQRGWIVRKGNRMYRVVARLGFLTYSATEYNPSKWI